MPTPAVLAGGNATISPSRIAAAVSMPAATVITPSPPPDPTDYDDLILDAGPVLYLPLDGTPAGLNDLSGRAHHGTTVGSTTAGAGPGDGRNSVRFSGSVGNYITVADHADLSINTTGVLTIEAWVAASTLEPPNAEGPGPDYTQPMGKLNYSGGCEWELRLYKNTTPGESPQRPNRFSTYAFNSSCGLGTGSYFQDPYVVDEWVHVVGVFNMAATSAQYPTGYVKIFKGGTLRDTDALQNFNVVPSNTSTPMRIGAASLDSFFAGRVARVALYNYELSPATIRSHYREIVPAEPGSITHVRHVGSGTATTASTAMHVNTPASGVPAGSTLICRVAHGYTVSAPTMTDAKGNTYVRDYTTPDDTNTIRTSLFRAYITAPLAEGDDIAVTIPVAASPRVIVVDEFEDVALSSPLIQANSDSGNSTGPTALNAPAVVTSDADTMIVATVAVAGPTSDTFTGDTGRDFATLTRAGVSTLTVNTEWKSLNETGTFIHVPALSPARVWSQIIAAYRAGSGQPTPVDYDGLVLAAGPVAYWTLNNTTDGLVDQTGNGHTATAFNAPTVATGIGDGKGSLRFNGTNQRLEMADAADLSIPTTGVIAIECWMSADVLEFPDSEPGTQDYVHVMGKNRYDDRSEYELRMYNFTTPGEDPPRPNRISGYAFNAVGGLGTGSYFQDPVAVDEWIHVVCVFRMTPATGFPSGYTRIFKNGVLRDTDSMANFSVVPSNTTAPFNVGTAALDSWFKGRVSKVVVWDREPTNAEIQARYSAAAPPAPPPPSGTAEFQTHVGSVTGASGTTATVTLTQGVPVGHTLIVHAMASISANTITCTDSRGNVYTLDRSAPDAGSTIRANTFSSRVTTALAVGDSIIVTWPSSVTKRAVSVNAWTKLAYPIVVDSSNGSTNTTATPSTSGTNTYGDALFVGAVFVAGPVTDTFTNHTAGQWTPLTRVGTSGGGVAGDDRTINAAWRSVPTADSYTYAPTLGTARTHIIQLLSYRASTYTPPTPPVGTGAHAKHLHANSATTAGTSLVLTVPTAEGGSAAGRPATREATGAGLKVSSGSLVAPTLPISGMTGSGTVRNIVSPGTYQGYLFPGAVNIQSNGVTIKNCKWLNPSDFWCVDSYGYDSIIEDCEIDGGRVGFDGHGYTVRRVKFVNMKDDPFHVASGSGVGPATTIEDCLAYDYRLELDKHGDGMQQWVSGIDDVYVRRCWIETKYAPGFVDPGGDTGFTSPIFLQSYPEAGTQGMTLVADCVLDTESNYAIRFEGPDSSHGAITCRPVALRNRLRASTETPLIEGGVPFEGSGNVDWTGAAYNHPSQIPPGSGIPDTGGSTVTVPVGYTVVLRVVADYTANSPTATDSKGNTYTLDKTVVDAANGIRTSILSARVVNALSGGDTIVVLPGNGTSTTRRSATADAFTGILHPVAVDRSATRTGTSTSPSVAVATVYPNDLIVAAVGIAGPSTDTFSNDTAHIWTNMAATGTSGSGASDRTIRGGWRSVGATGEWTYAPLLGTSRVWAAAVVAYKGG